MTKPIRKEFTTYWSRETVIPLDNMSLMRERFYERRGDEGNNSRAHYVVRPDDIAFGDLSVFAGRKTKVTIEIIE